MQTMQVEYSGKIEKDRQEVEVMIKELEMVQSENVTAEDDQMKILDTIALVEKDVYTACRELQDIRMNCTSIDLQNMEIKKQIDGTEFLTCDAKNVGLTQYEKIKECQDYHNKLTVECAEQAKRIETLKIET